MYLSTPNGGIPQSQVLSQVTDPRSFPRGGGFSVPGSFSGHWSQVLSRGYDSPGQGYPSTGYPPARSGWGTSGQDCDTPWKGPRTSDPPPPTRSGWGILLLGQNSRVSTCYAASCVHAGGLSCILTFHFLCTSQFSYVICIVVQT